MSSHTDRKIRTAIVAAALSLVISGAVLAAQPAPPAAAGVPDPAEIARAVEAVKLDPNLATERAIKTLRWKRSAPKQSRLPAWLSWITAFFGWLNESARILVWCAALGLAGLLAVYLTRTVRVRLTAPGADDFVLPTHVRDLDIRPETLPADIGDAARRLWDRGEHRAALALLYRGMLSRLAHVHAVPIKDSSTEGDCLALATVRLPAERVEYLARLVRMWQRFGYGRQNVDADAVYSLCDEFAEALRPVVAPDGTLQRGTA